MIRQRYLELAGYLDRFKSGVGDLYATNVEGRSYAAEIGRVAESLRGDDPRPLDAADEIRRLSSKLRALGAEHPEPLKGTPGLDLVERALRTESSE